MFKIILSACLASVRVCLGASQETPPSPSHAAEPAQQSPSLEREIAPILKTYCYSCHSQGRARAGVALDKYADEAAARQDTKTWQGVWQQLRNHTMPPSGKKHPSTSERELVIQWIETKLLKQDCDNPDPGRITLRRLNRLEYRLTVEDLLGVKFAAEEEFPADDVGYGFDNIGDVLSLSPLLMEKYLSAAQFIVNQALPEGGANRSNSKLALETPPQGGEREAAREFLRDFVRRAYRRPVTDQEIERLTALADAAMSQGQSYRSAMKLVMQAVLISPSFLYRESYLPEDASSSTGPVKVDEHTLASRLSYFLWSRPPDDLLLAAADQGRLRQNLDDQVRRMLRHPHAKALTENFAGQWLQLRKLESLSPDTNTFQAYDAELRAAMLRETERAFSHILEQDRSLLELIDADYTFLNERLARHYGIEGVEGADFRRVDLADRRRGGIITHASVLTLTSNPTRTSPVKRGKWILENLLGAPPPPPPPDVPELSEEKEAILSGTLRQRMEQHRANPLCASCHALMDPLGFAFENYDGIGAWRVQDGAFPVDASGRLPSGEAFAGVAQMKDILLRQKDQFIRCLSERLLTYALGRGLEPYDQCAIDAIAKNVNLHQFKFSSLVLGVAHSVPFQMRRGGSTNPKAATETAATEPKEHQEEEI